MLLYKYKAFSPLEHVLDIILHQRLYCAPYETLNDPFEGQFQSMFSGIMTLTAGTQIIRLPVGPTKANKAIPDLALQTKNTRVCSLSNCSSDVRLWSLYADGHKGVVFEFDFSGIENVVKKIRYTPTLPEFGTTFLGGTTPEEVLTCKTDQWEYEREYRIIDEGTYFPVNDRLRRIIVGHRASDDLLAILRKISPTETVIVRANLDHDGVKVHS